MSLSRLLSRTKVKMTATPAHRLYFSAAIATPMTAILRRAPIIPVLSIAELTSAVPLVKALEKGGMSVIEIALRTPHALKAIEAIRAACPRVTVGAATIITTTQFRYAIDAGAHFAASPLFCEELMAFANNTHFPYMPSVANTNEINLAAKAGFLAQKLFPLDAMGDGENGKKFLRAGSTRALMSELKVEFCASRLFTHRRDIKNYLSHAGVTSVASGWSAPEKMVKAQKWEEITRRAEVDLATAHVVLKRK